MILYAFDIDPDYNEAVAETWLRSYAPNSKILHNYKSPDGVEMNAILFDSKEGFVNYHKYFVQCNKE